MKVIKILITTAAFLTVSNSVSHARPGGWLLDIIKNNDVRVSSSSSYQREYYQPAPVYYQPAPIIIYRQPAPVYYYEAPSVPMRPYQQNSFYFESQPRCRQYRNW